MSPSPLPANRILIYIVSTDPLIGTLMAGKSESSVEYSVGSVLKDTQVADAVVLPCSRIRSFLTDRGSLPFIAYGPIPLLGPALLAGAVDILKTPIDPDELHLRVRRWFAPCAARRPWGRLFLDHGEARTEWGTASLNQREQVFLRLLLAPGGTPVSRKVALNALGLPMESRALDMLVSRFRRKLTRILPCGRGARVLRTIRGSGYILE